MKANTVEPQDVVLGRVIEFEMLTFICGLSGEPLPGVLGNKGTGAFIFREQGIL